MKPPKSSVGWTPDDTDKQRRVCRQIELESSATSSKQPHTYVAVFDRWHVQVWPDAPSMIAATEAPCEILLAGSCASMAADSNHAHCLT